MNFPLWQKFLEKHHKVLKRIPGLETRRNKKKFWRNTLVIAGYVILALIFATAIAFAWFSKDLPTPSKIASQKPTESTKIYDRTGATLLYETGDEKRTIIQSDQISQYLKDATVAVEDQSFYTNHGVEPKAILASIYGRLTGRSSSLRGGSTITQQYVKNALLTSDRSLVRKAKEAILAVELEFMFNKDQILTMYLNEIPYGNSTGGAQAASAMYFGKTAKDIDLAEAATLAAIPKAPTYYSPYGTHVESLVNRKNYVLDEMAKTGKITKDQADAAKAEDTTTVGKDMKARHDSILAPHFAMYVLEQIANKYGEDAVSKDSLKIITTLDYGKQAIAQQAITDNVANLKRYNAENAALVSIDPKTGQILDMVGSIDYFNTTIDGNVNVADSLRQPGSSFKIFDYTTLFKKNYSPSSIIFDLQTDFGGGYVPRNYNGKFNGPVTVRYALQNSLNIPAIKTLSLAGIDNTIQTAKDMGITSITQSADHYGLSMALGTAEVRPVEMASAYGTLANQGVHEELTALLKVTDNATGKVIYDYDKEHTNGKQVVDPQIAYEMSNLFSDNAARTPTFGSRSPLYFSDRTVAAKTGTTQDNRDGWTCGYTPSLATAVWTGNNMPSPMKTDAVNLAGPIFHAFMSKALSGTPNEPFTSPKGIQTVTVDKYSNKLPGPYTTETTTDIFADWQVPKDTDATHQVVTVCKGTNLVAPDNAPANLVESKVFINLHSERPDNPSWENPVIAWVQASGLFNPPPTAQCDINTINVTVSMANPADNAIVSGYTIVSANATSAQGIENVEFFIDGTAIGKSTASPYQTQYDFSSVSAGSHKLKAIATATSGATATSSEITISISAAPSISTPTVSVSSSGGLHATLLWTTNVATTSSISYTDGTTTKSATDSNSLTNHSMTLSSLSAGKNYSFTINALSADGQSSSTTGSFVTP